MCACVCTRGMNNDVKLTCKPTTSCFKPCKLATYCKCLPTSAAADEQHLIRGSISSHHLLRRHPRVIAHCCVCAEETPEFWPAEELSHTRWSSYTACSSSLVGIDTATLMKQGSCLMKAPRTWSSQSGRAGRAGGEHAQRNRRRGSDKVWIHCHCTSLITLVFHFRTTFYFDSLHFHTNIGTF